MNCTRRTFVKTVAAAAAVRGVCAEGAPAAKRWYKGNLHTHSFWSDGRAFPEQALNWYKSRGYNFCALADHNLFADDNARWLQTRRVAKNVLADYLAQFPNAEKRTVGGKDEYRLKTFAEYSALLNEKEKFLVLPAIEDTRSICYPATGQVRNLHMNCINLPGLPPEMARGIPYRVENAVITDFLKRECGIFANYAKKLARPHLFMLNHPIWTWYDINPEVLIDNPEVRFFEQCNNGSPLPPPASILDDGFDTDRFWDVVNAFRARRNQPFLYGLGNDDTHYYHGEGGKMLMPGNAWNLVRARALTPEAILAGFEAGESVVCEGVEPSKVEFDRATGTLTMRAEAKPGVAHTIRFIVSKRDFKEMPESTFKITPPGARPAEKKMYVREIKVYDRKKIGVVAKMVQGRVGEALEASYTLKADDLYVRARLETPGAPRCTAYLHPHLYVAWTQPYSK